MILARSRFPHTRWDQRTVLSQICYGLKTKENKKKKKNKYSQTCLRGHPREEKNCLLKTGDPLIQVDLHYILAQGTPKMWLLKTGDP